MTRTHRSQAGDAKVVVTEGMDLFRVADGRVQRISAYFDRLSVLIGLA